MICIGAAAFDKTPMPWPQLSTSHGPITSGGSIKEAISGSIDFLLTDMPMTDQELQQVRERRGVQLVHIATGVSASPAFRFWTFERCHADLTDKPREKNEERL